VILEIFRRPGILSLSLSLSLSFSFSLFQGTTRVQHGRGPTLRLALAGKGLSTSKKSPIHFCNRQERSAQLISRLGCSSGVILCSDAVLNRHLHRAVTRWLALPGFSVFWIADSLAAESPEWPECSTTDPRQSSSESCRISILIYSHYIIPITAPRRPYPYTYPRPPEFPLKYASRRDDSLALRPGSWKGSRSVDAGTFFYVPRRLLHVSRSTFIGYLRNDRARRATVGGDRYYRVAVLNPMLNPPSARNAGAMQRRNRNAAGTRWRFQPIARLNARSDSIWSNSERFGEPGCDTETIPRPGCRAVGSGQT